MSDDTKVGRIVFAPNAGGGAAVAGRIHVEVASAGYAPSDAVLTSAAGLSALRAENSRLSAKVAKMRAVLDELEGSFDQQTYTEVARQDYDAPDDAEYSVNITAKQLRAISKALSVEDSVIASADHLPK